MTFTERIRDYFLARPGQWVSGYNLMRVGGMCAWRTRVSEARRVYGLRIENRVRTYQDDGETIRVSEYRYVPDQVAVAEAGAAVGVSALGASVAPVSGPSAAVPAVRHPPVAVPLAFE